jgi:hypothetical protein
VLLHDGRFTKLDEGEIIARLAENAAAARTPRVARLLAVLDELRPHVHRLFTGWPEPDFQPAYVVDSLV